MTPGFLYFHDCVHMEIDDDDEVVEGMRNIKTINRRCGGDSMETIKGSMRPNPILEIVKVYRNTENRE